MTLPLVVCAAPLLKLPADMASVPVKGPGQGEGVCEDGGRGQETELGGRWEADSCPEPSWPERVGSR